LTVAPEVSVSIRVNENVPACVGVPLINPPEETANPGGIAELGFTENVTVPVLSHTGICDEYATPTEASFNVVVYSENGEITIVNVRTPMLPSES
jgi:hypothetical protein